MNIIENVNKVSEIIDVNNVSEIIDADGWYVKNVIRAKPCEDVIIARELATVVI